MPRGTAIQGAKCHPLCNPPLPLGCHPWLHFRGVTRLRHPVTAVLPGDSSSVASPVVAPHPPVPDLTVDLTAPARTYDNLGQRMFFGAWQTVDCAIDLVDIPTDVATEGNERRLGVFLGFKRQISDPCTDLRGPRPRC